MRDPQEAVALRVNAPLLGLLTFFVVGLGKGGRKTKRALQVVYPHSLLSATIRSTHIFLLGLKATYLPCGLVPRSALAHSSSARPVTPRIARVFARQINPGEVEIFAMVALF
jgi:hypothetical protein